MKPKPAKQGNSRDDDYKVGPGRPPKDTRFKPGQSGNPSGRPKGSVSIVAKMRQMLNPETASGRKLLDQLAAVAHKQARKGDFRFWNAVIERIDGKVPDKVEGDGTLKIIVEKVSSMEAKQDDDSADQNP